MEHCRSARCSSLIFGRELDGRPDELPGFSRSTVEIREPAVVATNGATRHPIVRPSRNQADKVEGTVLVISEAELAAADQYEVDDYVRIAVRLKSGIEARVYVEAAALWRPSDS